MFTIILITIVSVILYVLMLSYIVIETRRSNRRMHPNYYKNLDEENNITFSYLFSKSKGIFQNK
jgi:hypothetical protein